MKTRNSASGFTLIELAVVIAVTAILVTLMLPALAMSRGSGQGVKCLGNFRQLSAAWMVYATDNRDELIPNGSESEQPATLTDPSGLAGGGKAQWCPGRQDTPAQLNTAGAAVNVGYEWIRLGLLYPYVGSVSPYLCPADVGSSSAFGAVYPHVRSASMNAWLGPIAPFNGPTTVESYYHISDLVRPGPAQLFTFIDENPLTINDGSFICEPGVNDWIDYPATYHNDGSGLSFADGHAEVKRWTDQTVLSLSTTQVSPGNPSFVELAPSQNPPRDLTFLQNASTYLK